MLLPSCGHGTPVNTNDAISAGLPACTAAISFNAL
jgi:hypothetical protein